MDPVTVNELIAELIALREHHWCGDLEVVGVQRTWDGHTGASRVEPANYELDHEPIARPCFRRLDGMGARVVELAPEPARG